MAMGNDSLSLKINGDDRSCWAWVCVSSENGDFIRAKRSDIAAFYASI